MELNEKIDFHNLLDTVRDKILEVDGPHSKMKIALDALNNAYDGIIDDEVFNHCEHCCRPIFVSEDDSASSDDGCHVCHECWKVKSKVIRQDESYASGYD